MAWKIILNSDHVGAADPHSQYALDTDLSDHEAASNPHPQYAFEPVVAEDFSRTFRWETHCEFDPSTQALRQANAVELGQQGGAANVSYVTSLTDGVWSLSPGSNPGEGAALMFGVAAGGDLPINSAKRLVYEVWASIPQLGTTYQLKIGLVDTNFGLGTNGIFFRAQNGTNNGDWIGTSRASSTSSEVNSSITPDSTWRRFTCIREVSSAAVQFFIDGTQIGTDITTNIPSAELRFQVEVVRGADQAEMQVDFAGIQVVATQVS